MPTYRFTEDQRFVYEVEADSMVEAKKKRRQAKPPETVRGGGLRRKTLRTDMISARELDAWDVRIIQHYEEAETVEAKFRVYAEDAEDAKDQGWIVFDRDHGRLHAHGEDVSLTGGGFRAEEVDGDGEIEYGF